MQQLVLEPRMGQLPGLAPREHMSLAKILSGYRELVTALGGHADAWLEDAGIEPQVLELQSAAIPVRAAGRCLEDTAIRLGCADFGMRLAERQSMQAMMQPLEGVFCAAPTISDALHVSVRHMSAFNSGIVMQIDVAPTREFHLVDLSFLDGFSIFPQLMEQLILLTHTSVIWLSAGFTQSRKVWFSHLPNASPAAYTRRFNTTVEFGQEYDGLFLGTADLEARVANCNAMQFAVEMAEVQQRFPSRHKDIELRVRQAVFRILTQAKSCSRQCVAGHLGFQERTLNRHLSRRGTNFEAIRDKVRREMAFRYLSRADLPLTEIAGRLGFSELAVLSRCCRRWFGTSPRVVRQNLPAGKGRASQRHEDELHTVKAMQSFPQKTRITKYQYYRLWRHFR